MAITFVGVASSENSSTIDISGLGLAEGDIVYVVGGRDNSDTINTPSGYTPDIVEVSGSARCRTFYKIMGATPDTSVSGLTSNSQCGHTAIAFRGVDTTTPLDVASQGDFENSSNTDLNPPSITTVTDNSMILCGGFHDDDTGSRSSPSGYALGASYSVGSSGSGGTVNTAYKILASFGSENPGSFAGSNDQWAAFTAALRPITANDLLADDVQSTSEVTVPAGGQGQVLLAEDAESASEVTSPALAQGQVLLANDIQSYSTVGRSSAFTLDALDSEGNIDTLTPSLDDPSWVGPVLAVFSGVEVLLAEDTESASEVTSPALAQLQVLLAEDTESASEVTSPALAQLQVLLATSVEGASEVSTPALAAIGDSATFTSVDAHRGHGTGWAKKTLSQLDREKKKEIARLRKLARKRLKAEIDKQPKRDLYSLLAIAEEHIERTAPQGSEWLDPRLIEMTAILVMQGLEQYRADQQALSDENDRAILLLAA